MLCLPALMLGPDWNEAASPSPVSLRAPAEQCKLAAIAIEAWLGYLRCSFRSKIQFSSQGARFRWTSNHHMQKADNNSRNTSTNANTHYTTQTKPIASVHPSSGAQSELGSQQAATSITRTDPISRYRQAKAREMEVGQIRDTFVARHKERGELGSQLAIYHR